MALKDAESTGIRLSWEKYLKENNGKEEFTDLQEAWAIFSRAATSQPVSTAAQSALGDAEVKVPQTVGDVADSLDSQEQAERADLGAAICRLRQQKVTFTALKPASEVPANVTEYSDKHIK